MKQALSFGIVLGAAIVGAAWLAISAPLPWSAIFAVASGMFALAALLMLASKPGDLW